MLLTCATYNYLSMLTMLLASHEVSNPEVPLHVHAIEWPEAVVTRARQQYPRAVFHAYNKSLQGGQVERRGPVPRTAEILKLKVDFLNQAYQSTDKPVIWVDADTLLLSSIQPLIQRVTAEGDFGVTYRPGKRDHAKFNVAVLCFTRSMAAARLMEHYAQSVQDSSGIVKRKDTDAVAWFHDQVELWNIYRRQSRNFLGIKRTNAPRLVALTDDEHSIDGNTKAMFVGRRDNVFDLVQMQTELDRRGIEVKPLDSN